NPQHESPFNYSAKTAKELSSSCGNLSFVPGRSLRRSYRSQNEELYHSADRITTLSFSSESVFTASHAGRNRSLPYWSSNEDFYHARAKGFSVSSGDFGLRPGKRTFT
ncbi:Hypothetical predicted protein, partial [Paramuricea clavata]